ncbi:MAG TPA: DMT family transporter [Bacteroidia bacterium]|nr:DMT family transporter [Bacteroidia bacterium]
MSDNLKAHLSVLGANLIYGANYSIAKKVMPEYISPFGFIVVRVVCAAIMFFIAGLFVKEKIEKKYFKKLILCALFGVALNQLLFFWGLSKTAPINAALMMTTNPIMVLVMAHFILNEKIAWLKIIGIVAGIAGASTLIVFGKQVSLTSETAIGDCMVLVNSLSFAIFLIMVKPLMMKYHVVTIMKWVFLFGAFMALPFGFEQCMDARWSELTFNLWMGVIYVVAGTTFIAYFLNVIALKHLSPSVVSFYIYLQPVFATIFSLIFSEGGPNVLQLVSAILIFTGVYLVSKNNTLKVSSESISGKKN